MKVLVHACCAPCAIVPIMKWKNSEYEPTLFFYNPNVHPYREYRKRLDSFSDYCAQEEVESITEGGYGLSDFLERVFDCRDVPRCEVCYRMRLEETVGQAKARRFEGFSTTLLVSPYQKRDLILSIGKEMEEVHGVTFVDHDWRELYRDGLHEARASGLYCQSYCGCIFSEEERYNPEKKQKTQNA